MTDLRALTDIVSEIEKGRALLDWRDDLIRQHLAAGVPYRALQEATGLSRSALDTIRLGRRSR